MVRLIDKFSKPLFFTRILCPIDDEELVGTVGGSVAEALTLEALNTRIQLRGFTSYYLTFVVLDKRSTIRIGFQRRGSYQGIISRWLRLGGCVSGVSGLRKLGFSDQLIILD